MAGSEGDFQQLLVKARFEEARLRDLEVPKADKQKATIEQKPQDKLKQKQQQPIVSQSPQQLSANKARQSNGPRCYNCGRTGHLARECRQQKRGSAETKGKPVSGTRGGNMAAIEADGAEPVETKKVQSGQSRIEELRHQLQEAEVEEALTAVKATLHGIRSPEASEGSTLGPTIVGEVEFEGVPVKALLDTGSPVTIASLDWVFQALASRHPSGQTVDEWEAGVRARLKPPTVTLQSYGGTKLNVVGQMCCSLSRGQYSGQVVVQLQRGAPVPLLIGTDMQPVLGFAFLQCNPGGMAVDLLQGNHLELKEVDPQAQAAQAEQPPPKPVHQSRGGQHAATVHLLQAMRCPAQHSRLVRARVESPPEKSTTIFEADHVSLSKRGLVVEDGAVLPDDRGLITLAVHNYGSEPVHLEEGESLGQAEPATILSLEARDMPSYSQSECTAQDGQVWVIRQHPQPSEAEPLDTQRLRQLHEALGLRELELPAADRAKLCGLV